MLSFPAWNRFLLSYESAAFIIVIISHAALAVMQTPRPVRAFTHATTDIFSQTKNIR
jgi:hypothetical protein